MKPNRPQPAPYVAKPDPEYINAPQQDHPLQDAAILLAGFAAILLGVYLTLLALSTWALNKISLEQEMRWFGKIWTSQSGSSPQNDSSPQHAYLNHLLAKINSTSVPLQVSVLCSTELNAFALPGGQIVLTDALLKQLHSENGLLFVMAHELGHIVYRDHLQGMGRQLIFATGALLLGFGEQAALINTFNSAIGLSYSRQQESAADQYGLAITQKIYGHSFGAEELFALLVTQQTHLNAALAKLISTHPASAERLEQIKQSQRGLPVELVPIDPAFQHWLHALPCTD